MVRRGASRSEARALLAGSVELVAPDIIVTEVANALRRRTVEGTVTREQALDALNDLPKCFSTLVSSEQTVFAAFDLAVTLNHPFPDCVYLASAVLNGARPVTDDRKFFEKAVANERRASIALLADRRGDA
jgi:predicted nucleic acid-binding protein